MEKKLILILFGILLAFAPAYSLVLDDMQTPASPQTYPKPSQIVFNVSFNDTVSGQTLTEAWIEHNLTGTAENYSMAPYLNFTGLFAYWRMDVNSSIVIDDSGYGNNGTSNGNSFFVIEDDSEDANSSSGWIGGEIYLSDEDWTTYGWTNASAYSYENYTLPNEVNHITAINVTIKHQQIGSNLTNFRIWNYTSSQFELVLSTTEIGINTTSLMVYNINGYLQSGKPLMTQIYQFGAVAHSYYYESMVAWIMNTSWTSSGKYGGAFEFDGDNDFINVSNSDSFNTTDMTLSFWIKPNGTAHNSQYVIEKENDAYSRGFDFHYTGGNLFYFRIIGATETINCYTLFNPVPGEWTMITGIYNGTNVSVYVNGTIDRVCSNPGVYNVTQDLYIGSNHAETNNFNGTIDEVRIYNRSLSAAEILKLYGLYDPYINNYTYTYSTPLPAATYQYNFIGNYTNYQEFNGTPSTYLISQNSTSYLTLLATPAWSIAAGTQSIISCADPANFAKTLYRDGTSISNPYTATLLEGTYNFTCIITDQENYTDTAQRDLEIGVGTYGCTNVNTFAFSKTITPAHELMDLNFTDLVNSNFVSSNLGDVNVTGVLDAWINITEGGYYFVVNVTGSSDFNVTFGNHIVNRTYSSISLSNNTTDVTGYNEINPYYFLNFRDEKTNSLVLPPGTNSTLSLFCSGGETTFNLNDTQFLVATFAELDEIKAIVQYTATSLYYRNLISRSSIEHKNFYLVDANTYSILQLVITLDDRTGDFGDSVIKIKKQLEGNLVTVTELVFDAENKAIVYLVNGDKYSIYVDNGVEERSIGYLYADSSDLTKTLIVGGVDYTSLSLGNIDLNFTFGSIILRYNDSSNRTNSVSLWVYNITDSSLLFTATSTNRSYNHFIYAVPDVNATYRVVYEVDHEDIGTWGGTLFMSGEGARTIPPNFPLITLISGMGGNTALWIALLFIIPIPMAFGFRNAGFAALVMAGVVALLAYWNVYPINSTIVLPVVVFIAVMSFLEWGSRRRV